MKDKPSHVWVYPLFFGIPKIIERLKYLTRLKLMLSVVYLNFTSSYSTLELGDGSGVLRPSPI